MTMAEFNIRLFAFKRMSKDREMLFREVAWSAYISGNLDPKKMAKTKDKYWSIGVNQKKNSNIEAMRNAIEKAKLEYQNRKK